MYTALAFLIIIAVLVGAFFLLRLKMQSAFRQVVTLFRDAGATSPDRAVTVDTLGLAQPDFLRRAFTLRDYKPQALKLLIQADIIRQTDLGRLYLAEDALAVSGLKTFAKTDPSSR